MRRREFLAITAAAPAARAAEKSPAASIQPFPLQQVRLTGGPFAPLFERNRAFLRGLEPDRLLHTFRLTAGLPSSATPLGGWEAPTVELRGHFMGHYLSGCALTHAASGDEELRTRANKLVSELWKCQKAHGNGYLSAFPAEFFQRLKEGKKVWAPWYTLHKIMAGLLDTYQLCGNEQALDTLLGMARWTGTWAGGLTSDHMARVLMVEFGGMNEVLYNLYAVTRDRAHADLARRFEHARIFDPLGQGHDELKGLHANTNIPKIVGAARAYELTGERRYRDIASFFWHQVTGARSYVTGGTSNREHWRTDPGNLAGELGNQTQECCCTYNMLRLTRHIFSWTAATAAADYYERALFNGILGTMNPEDGMTEYFVPLASGYWKLFSTPRHSFWCCTGTGVESFSKPADSIYFHDARGLYVNLFIASELNWAERGVRLRQDTRFPEEQASTLTLSARKPARVAIRIRVPYWATRGAEVKVNGRTAARGKAGTYVAVDRTWKNGDKVEISLPMELHVEDLPGDSFLQAVMYGPTVLAGRLGAQGLTREVMYGDLKGGHILKGDPAPAPQLDISKLERTGGLQFRSNVPLQPLYALSNERYAVYWRTA